MPIINPNEVINGGIVRPTPLNARFDVQLLAPNVNVAELRFIKPLLCADLYNDMIAEKNASDANYNPNVGALVAKFPTNAAYEALWVAYLQELCARAVYFVSLPNIAFQTGSNGVYNNNSEFAQNAGDKGFKILQDNETQAITALTGAIKQYLCDNRADFPLYPADEKCECSSDCECDTCSGLSPYTKQNFGLIF